MQSSHETGTKKKKKKKMEKKSKKKKKNKKKKKRTNDHWRVSANEKSNIVKVFIEVKVHDYDYYSY